jgi:hypothetical protein
MDAVQITDSIEKAEKDDLPVIRESRSTQHNGAEFVKI